MKKLTIIALFVFSVTTSEAGVLDMGAGARATGMAEAVTAVADDASALTYNPAGLAQLAHAQLSAQHGQFLKGLTDSSRVENNYLGYAQPLKSGAMGFSYQNFKGSNYFNDRLLTLGYARKIKSDWLAGMTLKQFHREYEPNAYTTNALNNGGTASGQADPLFANNGMTTESYGVDAGLLHSFGKNKKFTAGAALLNINQMDVSLGDTERAPMTAKAGVAFHSAWGLISTEVRRTKRLNSADTDVVIGAERMVGLFGFRTGYGRGSRDFQTATAGFSFQVASVRLDYSFELQGNHRAALTYNFGSTTKPATHNIKETSSREYYLTRKAQGASASERLALLQMLLHEHKDSAGELTWIAKELSSL